jgi:hypothetical protein
LWPVTPGNRIESSDGRAKAAPEEPKGGTGRAQATPRQPKGGRAGEAKVCCSVRTALELTDLNTRYIQWPKNHNSFACISATCNEWLKLRAFASGKPTRRRSELDLEAIRNHIWYDPDLQKIIHDIARPLKSKPLPQSAAETKV